VPAFGRLRSECKRRDPQAARVFDGAEARTHPARQALHAGVARRLVEPEVAHGHLPVHGRCPPAAGVELQRRGVEVVAVGGVVDAGADAGVQLACEPPVAQPDGGRIRAADEQRMCAAVVAGPAARARMVEPHTGVATFVDACIERCGRSVAAGGVERAGQAALHGRVGGLQRERLAVGGSRAIQVAQGLGGLAFALQHLGAQALVRPGRIACLHEQRSCGQRIAGPQRLPGERRQHVMPARGRHLEHPAVGYDRLAVAVGEAIDPRGLDQQVAVGRSCTQQLLEQAQRLVEAACVGGRACGLQVVGLHERRHAQQQREQHDLHHHAPGPVRAVLQRTDLRTGRRNSQPSDNTVVSDRNIQ
jgi:hypothetical protein